MEAAFAAECAAADWDAAMADPTSLEFRMSYMAYEALWTIGTQKAAYRTPIQLALANGRAIQAWFTDPDAFGEWLGDLTDDTDIQALADEFGLSDSIPDGFDWARLASDVWASVEGDLTSSVAPYWWGSEEDAPRPVAELEDPQ
jgi:hypothetical protein